VIGIRKHRFLDALQCFGEAKRANRGSFLNTDQRLDLSIQEALCYIDLNKLDQAMLILSDVINDDAISSLRVKAMVLRAEVYEKQGRIELAKKQLEATANKGGQWAKQAKEKLIKDYGYD
jgi:Tfp pilus assembly protein PilF